MKLLCLILVVGVAAATSLTSVSVPWNPLAVDLVAVVGSKLFFKEASNQNIPFGDYLHFCHTNDMQTASIETAGEQAAVQGYMDERNVTAGFWLGGWKVNHEGNWTWILGEREMLYTNWMEGQPNESKNHSCIWYPGVSGEWRESRCTDTWVALCQLRV